LFPFPFSLIRPACSDVSLAKNVSSFDALDLVSKFLDLSGVLLEHHLIRYELMM